MKIMRLYIIIIFCLWGSIGWGQSIQTPEFSVKDKSLTAQTLNQEQLLVFEKRAEQKLRDFAGYLEIISNQQYDDKLRKHALESAEKLFYTKNAGFAGTTLSKFLLNLLNKPSANAQSKIKSVIFKKNFEDKSGRYEAIIQYEHYSSGILKDTKHTKGNNLYHFEMKVRLIKIEKKFGNQTSEVWEVMLGDVY